ncbi:cholestenol delta-isomerase [Strigomonas culicis]|uniref:Cholestenol delta-isomerase n=1 Tax=Strigomonas culicis TaxID=28005 RepID=S9WCL6_9TRYP|nr:cholestenol delta-isomerase [Strigomonas culicis]EPY36871.1 cholestenol delta-isomerase [Strigomonas culicis]|eukprot:EPY23458.1 cholestenol delta-isomerase [Strigomonas culicis]
MTFLEVFVDPMVLFCASCILTPLWVARAHLTTADVIEYFTEWSMAGALLLLPLSCLIGTLLQRRHARRIRALQASVAGKKRGRAPDYAAALRPLTYGERTRARWYLLNGIIIHMLMDGCVGVFKTSRLFAENYAKLDKRYGDPLGSFNGATVHVVSLMELCVKGPLCVLLYWAFLTRHPMRDALEFFTCVTQAYGTVVYLGQEAVSGAPNLDVDYALTFSTHYLLYFWFAIFFGCVLYFIVPGVLGWRSYQRLVRQAGFYQLYSRAATTE